MTGPANRRTAADLTDAERKRIRAALASGVNTRDTAKRFSLSEKVIAEIRDEAGIAVRPERFDSHPKFSVALARDAYRRKLENGR